MTICVGLDRPVLAISIPNTLEPLATFDLPPRQPGGGGNPFTDFSGGGYFYLDRRDRAVAPTTTRHIYVVGETAGPGLALRHDYDLTGAVPAATTRSSPRCPTGMGGSGSPRPRGWSAGSTDAPARSTPARLTSPIGNSFAVDELGGVYMVTDRALYRLEARHGRVRVVWRHGYPNDGTVKPGQTQAGSGTTPTLIAHGRFVAITDNADPVHIIVFQRRAHPRGVPRRLPPRLSSARAPRPPISR